MSLILLENLLLRSWDFPSSLNWIVALALSLLLKLSSIFSFEVVFFSI